MNIPNQNNNFGDPKVNIMHRMGKPLKKLEELDVDSVTKILETWNLHEFVEFVKEKKIDGMKLLDVTEGLVKLWRPKANAKKFMLFIEDLKLNSEKYLREIYKDDFNVIEDNKTLPIECQYQTIPSKKFREEKKEHNVTSVSVEDILKKLVPAKSFLYRNQQRKMEKSTPSYLPMDSGAKKPKRFFRLSAYEYPQLDIFSRFSRLESFDDRGYYSVKTNNRSFIQRTFRREDSRTKYKSLPATDEVCEKFPEDHFYEDLCYNDVMDERKTEVNTAEVAQVKPCLVKIQELFHSFKMPFFKKVEMIEEKKPEKEDISVKREAVVYENSDSTVNMYDSIHIATNVDKNTFAQKEQTKMKVEDYLEPVQLNKDYCDVTIKQRDESLIGYIMSVFENRFGIRRETSDALPSEDEDDKAGCSTDDTIKRSDQQPRANMADRPLPVPVENEPYYMNIDRTEAENLLRGQPDGTFVLRPSSQPSHAYTLSVACSNAVHNVGVRRRPDGRLALGFARRGERSFASVPSLLRHHRRRRLLLVAAGGVLGATTLTETPHYYQTPRNVPVGVLSDAKSIEQTEIETLSYYQTPSNIAVSLPD